jgi:hypothetical protein
MLATALASFEEVEKLEEVAQPLVLHRRACGEVRASW